MQAREIALTTMGHSFAGRLHSGIVSSSRLRRPNVHHGATSDLKLKWEKIRCGQILVPAREIALASTDAPSKLGGVTPEYLLLVLIVGQMPLVEAPYLKMPTGSDSGSNTKLTSWS